MDVVKKNIEKVGGKLLVDSEMGVGSVFTIRIPLSLSIIDVLSVRVGENGQETLLDGENVSGLIRTPEVSMAASTVSRYARVRKRMVKLQQELAASRDMILDGRDICTTVLPDADLKIYLTASAEERALRRWKEMRERGDTDSYEEVLSQVRERDEQDMNRPVEPLRQAEDAVLLDSTNLTFEQVIDRIAEMAEEVRHGN